MIKSKSRAPLVDIDVGSFSDVSFLLIIFFILTTQIASFKGNIINIPSGTPPEEQEQKKDEKKQVTVHLTGETIRVAKDEKSTPAAVNLEELRLVLQAQNYFALPEESQDRYVILEADDKVPYELYFNIVMLINEEGGYLCLMETEGGDGGDKKDAARKEGE